MPRTLAPSALESGGQNERGRLPHVVSVRLEGQSEQSDLPPHERPQVLLELRHHAALLKLVDLDHRRQELEVVARVAGELLQG